MRQRDNKTRVFKLVFDLDKSHLLSAYTKIVPSVLVFVYSFGDTVVVLPWLFLTTRPKELHVKALAIVYAKHL